jgi:hypothetical protein
MKKHLVLPMLAVLGTAIVLSFFATSFAFAQDTGPVLLTPLFHMLETGLMSILLE